MPNPDTGKLAYTPEEAAQAIGRTRTRVYELIANGELPIRKDGNRTLILRDDLANYLENLPKAGKA